MPNSLARLHDAPDQGVAIAGRHGDLVGQLAREGDAEQARRHAAHHRQLARPPCRERPRWRCRAGGSTILRSTSRERGPATENCAHCSVTEANCTSSSGHSHWWQNSRCCITLPALAVVVVTMKRSAAEPRGGAVVQHEAVLAQHQAVARLADGERATRCWCRRGRGTRPRPGPARRSCRAWRHRRCRRSPRTVAHLAVDALEPVVSPGRGYHCARSQAPVSTNTAPCSLRPVVRRRQPRRAGSPCRGAWPASAPIATGVKGGRKVVVPVCGMRLAGELGHEGEAGRRWRSCPGRSPCRAWCSASGARPSGSPRVPPAPTSSSVTSFWKSTKALPRAPRTRQSGVGGRALRVDLGEVDAAGR